MMPRNALVLFTGSRWRTDRHRIQAALFEAWWWAVQEGWPGVTLIHGACPEGGDAIVDEWAAAHGVPVVRMPADWDHCAPGCPPRPHRRPRPAGDRFHPGPGPDYCPGAGPRRNADMVARRPDYCLTAPSRSGRSGTRNCMRLAAQAGIPVHTIDLE